MKECNVLTLRERLASGSIQLIDVREYPEFAAGRIAGAKLMPIGEVADRYAELDSELPVFVVCRTGRRSAEAQEKLSALGFSQVVNVTGGFESWKENNLPFVKNEKAPWALERQVRFAAGLLVLAGVILTLTVHPYFVALSGFVGAGLAFAGATDWCGMGLLLAKMPWNRQPQEQN